MGQCASRYPIRYPSYPRPKWKMVQYIGHRSPCIDNSQCCNVTCPGRLAFDRMPESTKHGGNEIIRDYLATTVDHDLFMAFNVHGDKTIRDRFIAGPVPKIDPVHKIRIYGPYDYYSDTVILLVDMTQPISIDRELQRMNNARIRVMVGIGDSTNLLVAAHVRQLARQNNMIYFQDVTFMDVVRELAMIQRSVLCCHYCQLMAQIGSCPNKKCLWCRVGVIGHVF